jgi:hypothetical protein
MGPIGSPETSVSNHLTPRNNPEVEELISTATEALDHAGIGGFFFFLG